MLSFVAVMRDAFSASGLAEAAITWEKVCRSGTGRTSSTVAALMGVPRGLFKLIGELTVHTGEPVVGNPCVQS